MLTPDQLQAASDLLFRRWEQGESLPCLPEHLRPRSRAEGYAIQALLEQRSRHRLFGWKIAATSNAGQRHINVDGPLAGRLLAERARESGADLEIGANRMLVAEAEFAFRMEESLLPREAPYSMAEVMAAVGALHPAIEVPDSRYTDFTVVGADQLIADNACAHFFVLGPATEADWRSLDLAAHRVHGVCGGVEAEGVGANVLGDPRIALTWLANELSRIGVGLLAGQVATTGTCWTPMHIGPGAAASAEFGELGAVAVRFRP
ncbi:MAG: hydratase [Acidisphaera sp.]|nr:hydratase [Acidisphaera sp.]